MATHIEDLAHFIEALGAGPVDLVGHSRGGAVAAGLAGKRPDLVRRLVLAEPAILSLLPVPSGTDPRLAGVGQLNEMLAKGNIEEALEFFVDSVNAPGTWKSRPEGVRQWARDNVWTISRQGTDPGTIGYEGLAALKVPVLLIGGEKSAAMFAAILNGVQRALPGAHRVTLPNAGHQMSRDNAPAFAGHRTLVGRSAPAPDCARGRRLPNPSGPPAALPDPSCPLNLDENWIHRRS